MADDDYVPITTPTPRLNDMIHRRHDAVQGLIETIARGRSRVVTDLVLKQKVSMVIPYDHAAEMHVRIALGREARETRALVMEIVQGVFDQRGAAITFEAIAAEVRHYLGAWPMPDPGNPGDVDDIDLDDDDDPATRPDAPTDPAPAGDPSGTDPPSPPDTES